MILPKEFFIQYIIKIKYNYCKPIDRKIFDITEFYRILIIWTYILEQLFIFQNIRIIYIIICPIKSVRFEF